jgi:hypothetical protein
MERLPYAGKQGGDVPGDDGDGGEHDAHIEPKLFVAKDLLESAKQQEKVDGEIHPKQGHKHGAYGLNIR